MGEVINLVNYLEKELIKILDKKRIKYYSCIQELKLDGYKFMFMGDASITTEKEVFINLEDTIIYRTDQDNSIMFKIKNYILKIEVSKP